MQQLKTNKQTIILSLMALVALLILAACSPSGDEPPAAETGNQPAPEVTPQPEETSNDQDAAALIGSKWDLISYGGKPPAAGTRPTLNFDENGLGGTTGCNSYFGSYTISGSKLTIGEMGQTLMACLENEVMEQESSFLAMFQAAESFSLTEAQLIIHTSQGDIIFQPASHQSLQGLTWVLGGIAQGDAIVSMWVDNEITATFADGRVGGSAGCNQYFADYTLDGSSLNIQAIGSTKMFCEGERGERETAFLTALGQAAGYEIERDTLYLLDAAGERVLVFHLQMGS
jgi:heat shock protein HslJ